MSPRSIRVFVGSSSEANDISIELVDALGRDPRITADHWSTVFRAGLTIVETLEIAADAYDFAVFVAAQDDEVTRRNVRMFTARDNVILEFGLFLGTLGRERTFLVLPSDFGVDLPSDLKGVTHLLWDVSKRQQPEAAVLAVAEKLRRRMLSQPQRSDGTDMQLLDRDSIDRAFGTASKRLAAAEEEVRVSGNDCKFIVESRLADLRKALARGVRIKILCADPDVPSIATMLPVVDERFRTPREFTDSMISVARTLRTLQLESPDLFEYRYMRVLPAVGFFITDPLLDGVLKVETYVPYPWKPIDTRPHMVVPPAAEQWRAYFLNTWDNYWLSARVP
jgi:hypothetical protein